MKAQWIVAMLGVALAAGSAAAEDGLWREQSERVFEAQPLRGVAIENSRGTVSVRPSADGRIRLTALKITRAENDERARKFATETQVLAGVEGGRLVVRVRYPQRISVNVTVWDVLSKGFEMPRVEMRIGLEVPATLPVELRSTSGDLLAESVNGVLDAESTSGDVTVKECRGSVHAVSTSGDVSVDGSGPARVQTVSGSVEVGASRGPLRIATTSGDIVVRGAVDTLLLTAVSGDVSIESAMRGFSARTTSGRIEARRASGLIRAESSSGDVSVGIEGVLRRAEISSGSGDIELAIADRMACSLALRTSNGTLDLGIPVDVKSVSRHEILGNVRGGGASVQLRTSSGDIHVKGGRD